MKRAAESGFRVLIKARKLIVSKKNWTRMAYARDATGACVDPKDPSAVCFCVVGAIRKVSGGFSEEDAAFELFRRSVGMSPISFNDQHTHAEILDAFGAAITDAAK